ncbi:MAG TPA: S41 family peptidase [Blastocatellia bacterium]|nr:S41 family peptidase [Blastocatellia bacterium]
MPITVPLRAHSRTIMMFFASVTLSSAGSSSASGQGVNKFDLDRGHVILKTLKGEIKKSYYDPTFHGIDLEARFKTADEKIDRATSVGQIFGIVAQVLLDFEDSHLFFIPPQRSNAVDYGWQMQVVGDRSFVSAVKPGSDAETKGLKPGDEVIAIDTYTPARENLWKLKYLYYTLRPQPGMRVVLRSPDGKERQVDVLAKIKVGKRVMDLTGAAGGSDIWDLIRESENEDRLTRQRYYEMGDDLMVWKMPQFDLNADGVNDMMNKAKKHKALVLDLRGNSGGAEETLKALLGYFVGADVKIGDAKRRKENKPILVKGRDDRYKGKLVVLVDSQSASSSELFARVIQLEKAGTVIGDRSAGAVMRARAFGFQLGADVVVFYGASITDADLIMTDGKSLEHSGVTPDELLLPTAADLAAKRDPVLSRAAAVVGVKLDPEKAGSIFPVEWRK